MIDKNKLEDHRRGLSSRLQRHRRVMGRIQDLGQGRPLIRMHRSKAFRPMLIDTLTGTDITKSGSNHRDHRPRQLPEMSTLDRRASICLRRRNVTSTPRARIGDDHRQQ